MPYARQSWLVDCWVLSAIDNEPLFLLCSMALLLEIPWDSPYIVSYVRVAPLSSDIAHNSITSSTFSDNLESKMVSICFQPQSAGSLSLSLSSSPLGSRRNLFCFSDIILPSFKHFHPLHHLSGSISTLYSIPWKSIGLELLLSLISTLL